MDLLIWKTPLGFTYFRSSSGRSADGSPPYLADPTIDPPLHSMKSAVVPHTRIPSQTSYLSSTYRGEG